MRVVITHAHLMVDLILVMTNITHLENVLNVQTIVEFVNMLNIVIFVMQDFLKLPLVCAKIALLIVPPVKMIMVSVKCVVITIT